MIGARHNSAHHIVPPPPLPNRPEAPLPGVVAGASASAPSMLGYGASKKRVWVKRPNGTATTLLVSSTDIVDDLKSMVMMKFPNSLARYYDPADLVIKVELPAQLNSANRSSSPSSQVIMGKVNRLKENLKVSLDTTAASAKPAPVSPIPVSASRSSLLKSASAHDLQRAGSAEPQVESRQTLRRSDSPGTVVLTLEPDVLVWKILDTYFPQGMQMSDSFIIESPYHPSGDRPGLHQDLIGSGHTVSTVISLPPNPHPEEMRAGGSLSGGDMNSVTSGSFQVEHPRSLSPNSTHPKKITHRKTQSNPQSPSSTAVLLVPKSKGNGGSSNTSGGGGNTPIETEKVRRHSSAEDLQASSKDIKYNKPLDTSTPLTKRLPGIQENSEVQKLKNSELPSLPVKPPTPTPQANGKKSARQKLGGGPKRKTTLEKVLPHVNVLVVEDNKINQKIMAKYLNMCQVNYKLANTGKEAIEMWREGGFHLVFMDIQLPVMSGIEVTQEIRRLEKLNSIGVFAGSLLETDHKSIDSKDKLDLSIFRSPVIIVALTASTSQMDRENALAAGCNDFLTKPIQLNWLRNKITEWGCMQALIDFDHFRNDN